MSYILLTGATGMLGSVILKQLIAADFKVNTALRSFNKSKDALARQYPSAIEFGQLAFTEIPDMSRDGVFDEPLADASNFIHAATPLSANNFYDTTIKPGLEITDNVLRSAAKAQHLQRLIITGSIVSCFQFPNDLISGKTISEKDWSPITFDEGKSDVGSAYGYSKVTSEKNAWNFMEKEKPRFELVYLLAPSIIGKNMQVGWVPTKDALGGASNVYKSLFDVEKPGMMFPFYIYVLGPIPDCRANSGYRDVEDVAATHLMALDPKVKGNERYLFHANGALLGDTVTNFIREKYPQLRSRVPKGAEGASLPPNFLKTDISKSEDMFGTDWRGWEEGVVDIVEDLLRSEA